MLRNEVFDSARQEDIVCANGHHDDALYWPDDEWVWAIWRFRTVFQRFFNITLAELAELTEDSPIYLSLDRVGQAADAESCNFMRWCFYTDITEALERIIELDKEK